MKNYFNHYLCEILVLCFHFPGASERNSSQRLELDDIDISLEFSSHSNELILVEATKKTDYYKNTAMFEVWIEILVVSVIKFDMNIGSGIIFCFD